METKQEFRRETARRRKALDAAEAGRLSRIITDLVTGLPEYRAAQLIYLYIDYRNEVRTGLLFETALRDGKTVAAPRVEGREMTFYRISSADDLADGYMGISEPRQGLRRADGPGLMVMPGVAFDRELHRVGYGGGFYDRYLAAHPKIFRVAVAYEFQIYDTVPHEEFDLRPDVLVTERGVWRSRKDGTDGF